MQIYLRFYYLETIKLSFVTDFDDVGRIRNKDRKRINYF